MCTCSTGIIAAPTPAARPARSGALTRTTARALFVCHGPAAPYAIPVSVYVRRVRLSRSSALRSCGTARASTRHARASARSSVSLCHSAMPVVHAAADSYTLSHSMRTRARSSSSRYTVRAVPLSSNSGRGVHRLHSSARWHGPAHAAAPTSVPRALSAQIFPVVLRAPDGVYSGNKNAFCTRI